MAKRTTNTRAGEASAASVGYEAALAGRRRAARVDRLRRVQARRPRARSSSSTFRTPSSSSRQTATGILRLRSGRAPASPGPTSRSTARSRTTRPGGSRRSTSPPAASTAGLRTATRCTTTASRTSRPPSSSPIHRSTFPTGAGSDPGVPVVPGARHGSTRKECQDIGSDASGTSSASRSTSGSTR